MEDRSLLAQVGKLYYIDRIKQNEIAKRFQTSPMQISRLLKMAEDERVVSFRYRFRRKSIYGWVNSLR
jgi:DNA-binding transcriptional regulator LsrR (DeoR family)